MIKLSNKSDLQHYSSYVLPPKDMGMESSPTARRCLPFAVKAKPEWIPLRASAHLMQKLARHFSFELVFQSFTPRVCYWRESGRNSLCGCAEAPSSTTPFAVAIIQKDALPPFKAAVFSPRDLLISGNVLTGILCVIDLRKSNGKQRGDRESFEQWIRQDPALLDHGEMGADCWVQ